jgi:hypothetical protein
MGIGGCPTAQIAAETTLLPPLLPLTPTRLF